MRPSASARKQNWSALNKKRPLTGCSRSWPPRPGRTKKKAVVWELRDNLLYPHLVTKGESNGMLTAIAGETLREGMEIVSTAQILNRSDSSGDGSSATAGGENPFAPKMPPRRKPSTGNTKTAASAGNDGPPPPP